MYYDWVVRGYTAEQIKNEMGDCFDFTSPPESLEGWYSDGEDGFMLIVRGDGTDRYDIYCYNGDPRDDLEMALDLPLHEATLAQRMVLVVCPTCDGTKIEEFLNWGNQCEDSRKCLMCNGEGYIQAKRVKK